MNTKDDVIKQDNQHGPYIIHSDSFGYFLFYYLPFVPPNLGDCTETSLSFCRRPRPRANWNVNKLLQIIIIVIRPENSVIAARLWVFIRLGPQYRNFNSTASPSKPQGPDDSEGKNLHLYRNLICATKIFTSGHHQNREFKNGGGAGKIFNTNLSEIIFEWGSCRGCRNPRMQQ